MAQKAVLASGSFDEEFADIEAVSAHHGNNHEVLVARFYKRDRAPMFDLVGTLEFEAVSEDRRVLDALGHARAHQSATREYVSELYEGQPLDLGFASQNWQRAVGDRRRSGMLDRRRFEALVFTYLAEQLRTGEVAITGSDSFANWPEQLPPWEECGPKLAQLCEETGLPGTAVGFTAALRGRLEATAAEVDSGYPDNADLIIDENGVPVLPKQRAKGVSALAEALEAEVKARMPERTRRSKLTPAAIGQARLMYEAKDDKGKRLHTVAEIANAFNVTRGTIYRALEKTEQTPVPAQLPTLPEGSFYTDPGPATHLQVLADLLVAGAEDGER